MIKSLNTRFAYISNADAQTCSTEQAALVALYNAADGANWGTPWNTNVNLTADLGLSNTDWNGVETDSSCRVVKLKLDSNSLSGEIPTELGSLVSLTELSLNDNQLSGEIPTEFGNLTALENLDIGASELSGEMPAELGNLTSLTGLYLHNNQLSGEIPAELGELTSLTRLYLHENQLQGGIPTELGSLASLQRLYLNFNELSGEIPTELGNLTSLTQLYLNSNELSGEIPTELGNLTSLTQLYLSTNELSGEIPTELGNLTSLTQLYLSTNELSGEIPTELVALTSLQWLYLSDNELSGEIPTELGSLPNLRSLNLSSNPLGGTIPTELEDLTELKTLSLSSNQLSGEIPTELASLTSLSQLYLHGNQLSGEIPTELGDLTNLFFLVLGGNPLGGTIPTELGELTNLSRLYLSTNELSGEIPTELEALTSLQHLYLSTNELSGEIPTELEALTSLQHLYLSTNELSGEIPTELEALTSLQHLYLDSNELSGEIPMDLASPTNLEHLYLHNNILTGSIPTDLESIPASRILHEVSLWGNDLTFTESSELGKRIDRAVLRVLYNATGGDDWTSEQDEENNWLPIQGDFDSATFTVQNLLSFSDWDGVNVNSDGRVSELELSDNNLDGEVGNELEAPSGLETLNLSSNASLGGTLPVGMTGLTGLETLNIKCTNIETPTSTAFDTWLASIDFTDGPCVEPKVVTIVADSTSAIYRGGSADFTLTRTGAVDGPLAVTVNLTQDQSYLVNLSRSVIFLLDSATVALRIPASEFRQLASGTVPEKGTLTATVADSTDYNVGTANSAAVDIVIAATIGIKESSYTVSEEGGSPLTVTVVVRTGEGAPQPSGDISVGLGSFATGTATTPEDYQTRSEFLNFRSSDFTADGTVYEAEKSIDITIHDDVFDDSGETFEFRLEGAPGLHVKYWYNFVNSAGQRCGLTCAVTATITDTDTAAPIFTDGVSTMRDFNETIGDAAVGTAGNIGTAVGASDYNLDTLTYSLLGTDKDKFGIVATSGQIQTKVGEKYDHEVKSSYSVMVKVEDGNGESATVDVTLNVTDQDEAPLAPAAPSVSPTSGSTTSLDVTWSAPGNTGRPSITSYDLQYQKTTESTWTDGPQDQSGTSASIGSLEEGTAYRVQVRATNDEGDGVWSQSGTGTTTALPVVTIPAMCDPNGFGLRLCGVRLGSLEPYKPETEIDLCWDEGSAIPTGSDVVIELRSRFSWDEVGSFYGSDPFGPWKEIGRGDSYTQCGSSGTCVQYTEVGLFRGTPLTYQMRIRRGGDVLSSSSELRMQVPNSDAAELNASLSEPLHLTGHGYDTPAGPFFMELFFTDPKVQLLMVEMVDGLEADDFEVTNGTVDVEIWDHGTYKVEVTPTTLGEDVKVKLPATTVKGVGESVSSTGCGNTYTRDNTASNEVTIPTALANNSRRSLDEALTARFEEKPVSHDGTGFTLRIAFSEAVSITAAAITVTGGTVKRVKRVEGLSDLWEIRIKPDSSGDVTVSVESGGVCGEAGVVCTAGGQALSNGLEAIIAGSGT